jgi:hypothetical protein
MSRVCYGFFLVLTGALFLAGASFGESTAFAQDKDKGNSETARIVTVDGVKLNAVFYPKSSKSSSTVIMLHPIGQGNNIRMPGWKTLATELQKAGYSVLMFDFRGHGDSTTIEDEKAFFSFPANRAFKLKEKETIDYKDYKAVANTYLPVLVNDIAAVKAFLDRKNDAGACNTSSTIVIGAETGATLGAIWVNAQWSLYRVIPNGFVKTPNKDSEGKDVIACVWLSITPKLGAIDVNLAKTLAIPVRGNATATVFIYGDEDGEGKTRATTLEKNLKDAKNPQKFAFVTSYAVNAKTKLKGMKLLFPETRKDIVEYLDDVVAKKGAESIKRDFRTSDFAWRVGAGFVPAKTPAVDMNNFIFETFANYIGR